MTQKSTQEVEDKNLLTYLVVSPDLLYNNLNNHLDLACHCDIGWDFFGGHCYFLNETGTTWGNAKTQCQAESAYLVEIDSLEENAWITEKVGTGKCSPKWESCLAWTGGNDLDTEGLFIWSRGTEMNFTFWLPPEPNSYTVDDDCIVILYPRGSWADFPCISTRPYLCEKASLT
ncbi:lectin BRA-3-like [Ostrea edulis]|uniref:lectin BRA-3-like n=1 Tax=Ostrea edulis TaxID=37623 RepID=UPI0024AF4DC1|nr:lectin BRA-3-like [Ostrea edulis]